MEKIDTGTEDISLVTSENDPISVSIKDCVDKASRSNVFSVPAREKFTSISSMIQSKM